MDCEWRSKIDLYVDAELPEAESAQMEAHVLACSSCAAAALSRSQMKRAVRTAAVTAFSPRPEFRLKVESAIGARRPEKHWFSWPRLAFSAATAVAIIVLAIGWLYRTPPRSAVGGELVDLHVATLASANPVDVVSTDRHTVKPWFAGKLPFTFNLPDLENTPYRLMGGRVSYLGQAPGAQLLFAAGRHQVSVFIFQDRDRLEHLGAGFSGEQKLQFAVETWTMGGLRYFVVSDANSDEIRPLTNLLKAAVGS